MHPQHRCPEICAMLLLSLAACSDAAIEPNAVPEGPDAGADSSGDDPVPEDGPMIICKPGELRCADMVTIETCAPTGLKWEPSSCGKYQECDACFNMEGEGCIAACAGPCERLDPPTSAGCSFYLANGPWFGETLVSNPDLERSATISLYLVPPGTNIEELAEGPLELGPGESHAFAFECDENQWQSWDLPSSYKSGGICHIVSDLPVVARHSRINPGFRSGAALLLPEHMMAGDYVVYGYPPAATFNSYYDKWIAQPNFFIIIALEHQTTVQWWPSAATAGDGLPLPFVAAGDRGEQVLNRFDTIRIASSSKFDPPICEHDLSGTVVVADKPIWLKSGIRGASVPACPWDGCESPTYSDAACYPNRRADFMMEVNLPVDYWGQEYVGPHPPLRGNEDHFWRIYAGADEITVVVDPPQPGTPLNLAKRGDWAELVVPAGTNLQFVASGPIMPVQYVSNAFYSQMEDIGGPAMVQMTPVSRFLSRYVFATTPLGDGERGHFIQVVRAADGADVMLDGDPIVEWESFGNWLIANVEINEGAHRLESVDAFGANQYGYAARNWEYVVGRPGYAHGIGLGAEPTYIP